MWFEFRSRVQSKANMDINLKDLLHHSCTSHHIQFRLWWRSTALKTVTLSKWKHDSNMTKRLTVSKGIKQELKYLNINHMAQCCLNYSKHSCWHSLNMILMALLTSSVLKLNSGLKRTETLDGLQEFKLQTAKRGRLFLESNKKNFKLPPYFFCPPLHSIITFGDQLLVEKAVEKVNLKNR